MWLSKILGFLGSSTVSNITDKIGDAYEAKIRAETSRAKLDADIVIKQLESRRDLLIAEQRRWLTAWIRPLLALPVVIYIWKIIVYDTVLQLGVTPNPGEMVNWIVLTVVGAYFLTRPFEKK